jgi:hypothetical protein
MATCPHGFPLGGGLMGASAHAIAGCCNGRNEKMPAKKKSHVNPFVPTTGQLLDRIRSRGWRVAVHNDYRFNRTNHTFWLFTKGPFSVKGEGTDDVIALKTVCKEIDKVEGFRDQMRLGHWEAAARVYKAAGWMKEY